MAHVITQPCCNDAGCVAVCPVDCIRPRPDEPGFGCAELLHIDPATCIDCGACVDECPVDAIVPEGDLTPLTAPYRELNAVYFADAPDGTAAVAEDPVPVRVSEAGGPLRVAIIGSGPAACYAAEELLARRDVEIEVTVFDRLPTPMGLVRYGVAPDHQQTKQIAATFGRTLNHKRLTLELNVEVGHHIEIAELLDHHHAVLCATGAARGRELGVPGETLAGVHSATDFVGWYNGHPDHAHRVFDLSAERAVVIGNGNVALDVARILVSEVAALARTDIADHALEALAGSMIREVVVVGRRGPDHAAYTTPELLGLGQIPHLDLEVGAGIELEGGDAGAVTRLKTRLAAELSAPANRPDHRRVRLEFYRAPVGFRGDTRVTAVELAHTEPVGDGRVRVSDRVDLLPTGLVFTSVGYRAVPIPGLPFDLPSGTIPNDRGRVTDPSTGRVIPGAYVAGWVKRGPSGVIGTNKHCSRETVRSLVEDFAGGRLPPPGKSPDQLDALLTERQPLRVAKRGWKAIDAAERGNGRRGGRPRVKFVEVESMLRAAGVAAAPAHAVGRGEDIG